MTLDTAVVGCTDLVSVTRILYKLCAVWLLNLHYVYVYDMAAYMYVIVSIKRLRL